MAMVEGLPDVLRRLDELDKKVANKVLRTAVTKSARALVKDTKRRIRSKSIKRALTHKVKSRARFAEASVGAKKRQAGAPARLFHLFEFGTAGRVQRTTGRRTGSMPSRPALRPAVIAIAKPFQDNLVEEFRKQTGAT